MISNIWLLDIISEIVIVGGDYPVENAGVLAGETVAGGRRRRKIYDSVVLMTILGRVRSTVATRLLNLLGLVLCWLVTHLGYSLGLD